MKKVIKKAVLYLTLAVICVVTVFESSAGLADSLEKYDFTDSYEVTVTGNNVNVSVKKSLKLEAEVQGLEVQPEFSWKSSDEGVAKVDSKGEVKGLKVGRTVISATANIDGKDYVGYYAVNVTTRKSGFKNFMEEKSLLSFKYSYADDFYYANDKDCWQDEFGYSRFYDLMAPYFAVMEYDYIRVFFTHEDKDFMVELWKGQYTPVLFGGEIGIYTKEADGKNVGVFTFFHKAEEKYWPKMEMHIFHQKLNGEYERAFTREYDTYWWITGFKPGHLRVIEPADELRMVSRITFTDEKIAELFANGMKECGFTEAFSKDSVKLDGFYRAGSDVFITWQNISEAENTVPVKITGLALVLLNIFAFICALLVAVGLGSVVLAILII